MLSKTLTAIASLALTTYALPASYSVVDVDGGSYTTASPAADSSPAPKVIYSTVTKSTDNAPTETVSVTVPAAAPPAPPATTSSSSSSSTTTPAISTLYVTETAPSPPSTTSYYDDGLWHTYYPVKDFQPPPSFFSHSSSSSADWNLTAATPTALASGAIPTAEVSSAASTTPAVRLAPIGTGSPSATSSTYVAVPSTGLSSKRAVKKREDLSGAERRVLRVGGYAP